MASNGIVSARRWMTSDKIDGFDLSTPDILQDVHVLAVDDSLVDRKVIERLLKITSCKGLPSFLSTEFHIFIPELWNSELGFFSFFGYCSDCSG